jgi:hypothetical protein
MTGLEQQIKCDDLAGADSLVRRSRCAYIILINLYDYNNFKLFFVLLLLEPHLSLGRISMSRGSFSTLDPADSRSDDRAVQSARHRSRLTTDQTSQSRLFGPDALRMRLVELDGRATRTFDHRGRTRSQSGPSCAEVVSGPQTFTPRSSPRDETGVEGACRSRRQAAGLVKNALYLLIGVAATGWFAAFVHETQVSGPMRDANPHAPQPDHESLTGVGLHPVLYDLVQDKKSSGIHISSSADRLGQFLAERGLSYSGSVTVMRIEAASSFDDPILQAKFGLKYSYSARDPELIVKVLSNLCDPHHDSGFVPDLRHIPLHRLDIANLPEPMDAAATLDLLYRRQEFGLPRPDWR